MSDNKKGIGGIGVSPDELDLIIRGKAKLNLDDFPKDAVFKRIWYDGYLQMLCVIYEHESFESIGQFPHPHIRSFDLIPTSYS